jgi:hypothetical protein
MHAAFLLTCTGRFLVKQDNRMHAARSTAEAQMQAAYVAISYCQMSLSLPPILLPRLLNPFGSDDDRLQYSVIESILLANTVACMQDCDDI